MAIDRTAYNATVNDDGSNTVGTLVNKQFIKDVLLDPIDAAIAAVGGSDATLATSDITTNDVSITKHGFAPKAPNDATKYLNGVGAWTVPAGGGGGSGTVTHTTGALTASALLVGNGTDDAKPLASLGTTATVLHGNAAGLPTYAAVAQSEVTNLVTDLAAKAPLASPTFTGPVNIPTPATGNNTTLAASTAFVQAQTVADAAARPRAAVNNSTAQAVTTATFTLITFNTETFDVGAMHSTVTNTSRLTVPAGQDGLYLVAGTLTWAGNATGQRQGILNKNGVGMVTNVVGGSSAFEPQNVVVGIFSLVAADYIELQGYQDSGGNLNTSAAKTQLSIVRLL